MFRVILIWYLLISFITFITYWLDKRAAVRHQKRIAERTLHLLALGGGFPGALCGMNMLRHKRRKRGFVFVTWLILLLHLTAWTLLVVKG